MFVCTRMYNYCNSLNCSIQYRQRIGLMSASAWHFFHCFILILQLRICFVLTFECTVQCTVHTVQYTVYRTSWANVTFFATICHCFTTVPTNFASRINATFGVAIPFDSATVFRILMLRESLLRCRVVALLHCRL